jgi:hypothetical protein
VQAGQVKRDEQQAKSGPEDQNRAEHPAGVAAVLVGRDSQYRPPPGNADPASSSALASAQAGLDAADLAVLAVAKAHRVLLCCGLR